MQGIVQGIVTFIKRVPNSTGESVELGTLPGMFEDGINVLIN